MCWCRLTTRYKSRWRLSHGAESSPLLSLCYGTQVSTQTHVLNGTTFPRSRMVAVPLVTLPYPGSKVQPWHQRPFTLFFAGATHGQGASYEPRKQLLRYKYHVPSIMYSTSRRFATSPAPPEALLLSKLHGGQRPHVPPMPQPGELSAPANAARNAALVKMARARARGSVPRWSGRRLRASTVMVCSARRLRSPTARVST